MKKLLCVLILACVLNVADANAATTINATNFYSYGANIGFVNWRTGMAGADVVIGEFVCSGFIWGANVGWIDMGDGTPANNIQYSNSSGTDCGVNYGIDPTQPGVATLRGYAYGANIGWINFEATGNPRIRFTDGRLLGYAYSANCGWINLGEVGGTVYVQTDTIAMGLDSDGDGMADAFEYLNFGAGNLTHNGATDSDGDGVSDLTEYLEGTNPLLAGDRLRITAFSITTPNTNFSLTFMSTVARLYTIETTTDLSTVPIVWSVDTNFGSSFAPNAGTSTTRSPLIETAATKRFFHVKSVRPLSP